MNANDLLDGIGEAKGTYVWEAQKLRSGEMAPRRRISFQKILLIAAIIALMLALVGCTVAYVLSVREKKIGQITTSKYYNDEGQRITPTEYNRDVVSLFGYSNSPAQMATKEWYEFTQTYDPNGELRTYEDALADNYTYTYLCYTQEMADTLDEIVEKYGLKLLSTSSVAQRWDSAIFFEGIGVDSLCRSDAQVEVENGSGYLYPEGAFKYDLDVTLTGENPAWDHKVYATVHYVGKEYFSPHYTYIDPETYEEWVYTTSDGTQVLIAMENSGGVIFAEQENAYLTISINTNILFEMPVPEEYKPTRETMEQLAEVFDYSIRPEVTDMEGIKAKLKASQDAWEAEQAEAAKPSYFQGDFAGFLEKIYGGRTIKASNYYTFADINGDGVDDLLMGTKDGIFYTAYALADGNVVDLGISGEYRLCENGAIVSSNKSGYTAQYYYVKLDGYDMAGNSDHYTLLEYLRYNAFEDVWKYSNDETIDAKDIISAEEAEAIQAKYLPVELTMWPLSEFPIDENGKTLGQVNEESRIHITEEQRMAVYAAHAQKQPQVEEEIRHNYYCLRDLNGDGVIDFLVGKDADHFCCALTEYNGELRAIEQWRIMSLCEGNILKCTGSSIIMDTYTFYKFENAEMVTIDYLQYDAQKDLWSRSNDGDYYFDQQLTAEEAQEILDSYVVMDLGMKPIDQFPGE